MKPERVKREAERLKQGPNSNENPCDIITVRFIVRGACKGVRPFVNRGVS